MVLKKFRSYMVAVSIATTLHVRDARAQDFEVEGELTVKVYNSGTTNMSRGPYAYLFSLVRHGCTWRIRTSLADHATNTTSLIEYEEVSFDGTNQLKVLKGAEDRIQQKYPLPGNRARAFSSAFAYSEVLPHPDASQASVLYLAYVSSCYFDHLTNHKIKPFGNANKNLFTNAQYFFYGDWSFDMDHPKVLRELNYYSDGYFWTKSADGPFQRQRYTAPYSKGFLTGRYVVDRFFSHDGLRMPGQFRLLHYTPARAGGTSNDLFLAAEWIGRTLTARQLDRIAGGEGLPALPGKTHILDSRFGSMSTPLSYVTESNLPPVSAPLFLTMIPAKDLRNRLKTSQTPRVLLSVMAVTALGLPFFFLSRWLVIKNKATNSQK